MELFLHGHDYRYAVEQILITLFPDERPEYPVRPSGGKSASVSLRRGPSFVTASCALTINGQTFHGRASVKLHQLTDRITEHSLMQRIVKLCFYRAALRAGVNAPVWGALTGVRPAALLASLLESEKSERAALRAFQRTFFVDDQRALLCLDAAKAGIEAGKTLEPGDICLYVGIPFCPTRCAYCSFVSQSVEKSSHLIEPFLSALELDMKASAEAVRELGLRPVALYVGGGTPTTLGESQLDRVFSRLETLFDLSSLREYTVEAGRPDTITPGKLQVLKAHRVTRVSVNPQTMEDGVLSAIGRAHSSSDVLRAMETVRECGSFAVNTDIIAGLPSDTPAGFSRTLDKVLALSPENITVHTLSLKKGSRITLHGAALPSAGDVGAMLSDAAGRLPLKSYAPYYLYRQKFMSGGFENIGWTLEGFSGLYNMCIMEELSSVVAMGGGASTKLVSRSGLVKRIIAPKYPAEYIGHIQDIVKSKSVIKEFRNGNQT